MNSSACIQSQQRESTRWVSFGFYEPQKGCNIQDAVNHMARVAAVLELRNNIKVAILKSIEHSWVAVFAVWAGESDTDNHRHGPSLNLPEAAAFTKGMNCAVRIVESGWFRQSSQEISKGVPFAQLSLGDIVSLRRIYTPSSKIQEVLSYCCLAILKSYFSRLKGIQSCSFYDSLDGTQIIGLGVWDSVESASVLEKHPKTNPALPFWKGLGAKKLKFHVWQVAYVTNQSPVSENSRPGFRI